MIRASPDRPPAVAPWRAPAARPCGRFGAMGRLKLGAIDVLPASTCLGDEAGAGVTGAGRHASIVALRSPGERRRLLALLGAVRGEQVPEGQPPGKIEEVVVYGVILSGQEPAVLTKDRCDVCDCRIKLTKGRRARGIAV